MPAGEGPGLADLDPDALKARLAVSHVGCGWQFCPRAWGGSIWFFRCGTEVLLVSLRGRLSAGGSLSPRGGRHSWPHILGPAASVLKARCGEARADRCVPHLASRQVDPDHSARGSVGPLGCSPSLTVSWFGALVTSARSPYCRT